MRRISVSARPIPIRTLLAPLFAALAVTTLLGALTPAATAQELEPVEGSAELPADRPAAAEQPTDSAAGCAHARHG